MEKVPDECSVVLVAGPESPYLAHELTAVDAYLKGGGRALILLPPRHAEEFVDSARRGASSWATTWSSIRWCGSSKGRRSAWRRWSRPTTDTRDHPRLQGAHAVPDDPLGARRHRGQARAQGGRAGQDEPVELGRDRSRRDCSSAARRSSMTPTAKVRCRSPSSSTPTSSRWACAKGRKARLAVFGSVEFAQNREIEGTYYNRDLLMNTIGWLVGQSDLVSIRPRACAPRASVHASRRDA